MLNQSSWYRTTSLKLMLTAAILSIACFCNLIPARSAPPSSGGPKIQFLRPGPNEKRNDSPIYVQVQVSNFNLKPPVEYFSKVDDGKSGHIHFTLDNFPIMATDHTQVMFGKMIGDKYLAAGKHIIRAELVKMNHESLKPPQVAEVVVFTSHPASAQEDVESTSSIQRVQEQLMHVQAQLQSIEKKLGVKSGSASNKVGRGPRVPSRVTTSAE